MNWVSSPLIKTVILNEVKDLLSRAAKQILRIA